MALLSATAVCHTAPLWQQLVEHLSSETESGASYVRFPSALRHCLPLWSSLPLPSKQPEF